MRPAEMIVMLLGAYAGFGVLFALAFVTRGAERLDPAVKGSGLAFRLLIFPGSAALWPLLICRWRYQEHES